LNCPAGSPVLIPEPVERNPVWWNLPGSVVSIILKLDSFIMICRPGLLKVALLSATAIPILIANELESAWRAIRPIIHADDEQRAAAMRSAPEVFLAEIQGAELYSEPRQVEKPASVDGPLLPAIPLHLARITAKPLLFLRGSDTPTVGFYSWVWVSGKHGGPRLFNPTPKSFHVLFVKPDSGYLHTVGDYPSYDIELQNGKQGTCEAPIC
jgi:hypothetical protein